MSDTARPHLFGLTAAILGFTTVMLGTTMPTSLYPLLQQRDGYTETTITVIYAVYVLGVLGALLGTGRWSDEIGRKPMLILGLVCAGASDLIFWQAQGLSGLLLGRFVSGLSAGIFTGAATIAVTELAGPRLRELGTFAAIAANMGGLGIGPLFAASAMALLPDPYAAPFLVHLGLAGLCALLLLAAPETARVASRPRLRLQRLALPTEVVPVFIPAIIAAFAGFMVLGFFAAISPAFMGQVLGRHDPFLIGADVAALLFAAAFGQVVANWLPESWRMASGLAILLGGMAILALGLGMAWLAPLFLGGLVAGTGHGIAMRTGLGAVTAAAPPDQRASVTSTFFTIAYVALSLPVIGVGLASSVFGLRATSLGFAAIVALLCAIAIALLSAGVGRPRSRPAQSQ